MMFALELTGLILLVIVLSSLYITVFTLLYKKISSKKTVTRYYIINESGNVFKEYNDEITRDRDLESYTNIGFNFVALTKIHTKK